MPIFFLILGVLFIVVGINNKVGELADLVKEDFVPSSGSASFTNWALALIILGSLGYIKELKPVANAMLVLVIISMLLANKGFFDKFNSTFSKG